MSETCLHILTNSYYNYYLLLIVIKNIHLTNNGKFNQGDCLWNKAMQQSFASVAHAKFTNKTTWDNIYILKQFTSGICAIATRNLVYSYLNVSVILLLCWFLSFVWKYLHTTVKLLVNQRLEKLRNSLCLWIMVKVIGGSLSKSIKCLITV